MRAQITDYDGAFGPRRFRQHWQFHLKAGGVSVFSQRIGTCVLVDRQRREELFVGISDLCTIGAARNLGHQVWIEAL